MKGTDRDREGGRKIETKRGSPGGVGGWVRGQRKRKTQRLRISRD